ncbi:aldehyde dehydrogenase [Earliella scabrosa]|nr:aldehyde dehydrogenase [Earliella scabrosa]
MSNLVYTPLDEIPKVHARALQAFLDGKLRSIPYRKAQIAQLGYMIKDNEQRFLDAFMQDLGRPVLESKLSELLCLYQEVRTAYDSVEKWTAHYRPVFDLNSWAMSPKIRPEAKGVVLVIAPFNAPMFLLLAPLVGAIAGGNAAVLKPSELAPAVSSLIAELLPKYLDNDMFHVVNGDVSVATRALELKWDHILYTGHVRVGRIIAMAAAKYLTPVTLELGGKNPVVVDPRADQTLAARRVLWGRMSNAGQLCISPEYVLVTAENRDAFIEALKEVHHTFYPEGPRNSASYGRLRSAVAAQRIKDMLESTQGTIVIGGECDVENRYVAPTVVVDVPDDDRLVTEEIFGPVLLIVTVKGVDEAIKFINAREHPLAIYVFSPDKAYQEKVFSNTQSGAAVANDVCIHPSVPGLPLGGVGASGYGYTTGKDMFDQFTHKRPSLDNPSWSDTIGFKCRYPPYTSKTTKAVEALAPSLPPRPQDGGKTGVTTYGASTCAMWLSVVLVGACAASIVLTRSNGLKLL